MKSISKRSATELLSVLSTLSNGEHISIDSTLLTPYAITMLKSLIKISYILPLASEVDFSHDDEKQFDYYNGITILPKATYVKINEDVLKEK